MEALKDDSTFDFVGSGATNIAKPQLTGAHIDLVLLFEAVEKGIRKYPVPGCDYFHHYIEKCQETQRFLKYFL